MLAKHLERISLTYRYCQKQMNLFRYLETDTCTERMFSCGSIRWYDPGNDNVLFEDLISGRRWKGGLTYSMDVNRISISASHLGLFSLLSYILSLLVLKLIKLWEFHIGKRKQRVVVLEPKKLENLWWTIQIFYPRSQRNWRIL